MIEINGIELRATFTTAIEMIYRRIAISCGIVIICITSVVTKLVCNIKTKSCTIKVVHNRLKIMQFLCAEGLQLLQTQCMEMHVLVIPCREMVPKI